MSQYLNFFIVVGVQFLFFLFTVYLSGTASDVNVLARSHPNNADSKGLRLFPRKGAFREVTWHFFLIISLCGMIFGIAFDLLVGKYLGVFDYTFGFQSLFLALNGALSYGLMMATVSFLRSERFSRFYLWTVIMGVVYECSNYLFPVWYWRFGGSFLYQEAVVILAAYCGLSLLMAVTLSLVMRTRFRILNVRGIV